MHASTSDDSFGASEIWSPNPDICCCLRKLYSSSSARVSPPTGTHVLSSKTIVPDFTAAAFSSSFSPGCGSRLLNIAVVSTSSAGSSVTPSVTISLSSLLPWLRVHVMPAGISPSSASPLRRSGAVQSLQETIMTSAGLGVLPARQEGRSRGRHDNTLLGFLSLDASASASAGAKMARRSSLRRRSQAWAAGTEEMSVLVEGNVAVSGKGKRMPKRDSIASNEDDMIVKFWCRRSETPFYSLFFLPDELSVAAQFSTGTKSRVTFLEKENQQALLIRLDILQQAQQSKSSPARPPVSS